MLLRSVAVVVLLVACARAPAEKPQAEPRPGAVATPAAAVSGPAAAASDPAPAATPAATASVEFARDVRPILESRCQPCHFAGGRMYDRLPFDRPETIRQLGPKLFSRIKDEESQRTIRAFLSQGG